MRQVVLPSCWATADGGAPGREQLQHGVTGPGRELGLRALEIGVWATPWWRRAQAGWQAAEDQTRSWRAGGRRLEQGCSLRAVDALCWTATITSTAGAPADLHPPRQVLTPRGHTCATSETLPWGLLGRQLKPTTSGWGGALASRTDYYLARRRRPGKTMQHEHAPTTNTWCASVGRRQDARVLQRMRTGTEEGGRSDRTVQMRTSRAHAAIVSGVEHSNGKTNTDINDILHKANDLTIQQYICSLDLGGR